MTGLLAVAGIFIVMLASAYSGLTSSDTEALTTPGFNITPVRDLDVDNGEDAASEDETPAPDAPEGEGTGAGGTEAEGAQPEGGEQQPADAAPAGPPNRADCNQIRGTQYLSPEERTWFLANCVN